MFLKRTDIHFIDNKSKSIWFRIFFEFSFKLSIKNVSLFLSKYIGQNIFIFLLQLFKNQIKIIFTINYHKS